jgi:2-methylcitrate dehydratase PrpD
LETTREIAKFVANTPSEAIPQDALSLAKKAFVDCLGVCLAGASTEPGTLVMQLAKEIGKRGRASVIGGHFRCHPSLAALANGVSAHALDYDDFIPTLGHTSAVLVPVGIALGEEMGLSGKAILEAYVLGVEVGAKVASCLAPQHGNKGWHTTGTLGTIAAGAMAAKLLGLNVEQICSALALSASQAAGMQLNFGSMAKPFHAGNAARSGVMAALLSQRGFSGCPAILEGTLGFCSLYGGNYAHLDQAIRSLGAPFHLVQAGIHFKRYSCCGKIEPGVDIVLELREGCRIDPGVVERIECWVPQSALDKMPYNIPSTPDEARFSIPFCLSTALNMGKLGLGEFEVGKISDRAIVRIMERVKVFPWNRENEKSKTGDVSTKICIRLKDGRLLERHTDEIKGSPSVPLTVKEARAKFLECSKRILSREKANEVVEMIESFETLASVRKLTRILS